MAQEKKIKILIVVANPFDTAALTLDEEYQRIHSLWRSCDLRDQFDVHPCFATRAETLQSEVLQFKPHLIHFSGHGTDDNLIFADSTGYQTHKVSKSALAVLFKLCAPDLKAVFLNVCHSAINAEDIAEQVDYFIGMNDAIDDKAGTVFSQGFYSAIFNQNTLDIEQAFKAGRNQMEIYHIAEAEQQKLVLQKHAYVPSYQHDVFISFADEDKDWADNFINGLRKQLQLKLATFDGFQLYTCPDFSQLEQSAILLIIYSPDYYQQYQAQFEQLGAYTKQQTVFLIEKESHKLHDSLKGLSRYKFWVDDDQQGIMSLQGDAYIAKANEVAELVAKKLQELRAKHEGEKHFIKTCEAEEDKSAPISASVFLNSAPEDLDLTQHIKSLLKKNGVKCVLLPMERSKLSPKDIRDDIESKISGCDAVLVLCEKTTAVWASKQIMDCLTLQRKRETPFKIVAIHRGKDQPDLGIDWDLLKTYECPPQQVETYLQEFIGALS